MKKLTDTRIKGKHKIVFIGTQLECIEHREKNYSEANHPLLVVSDVEEGDTVYTDEVEEPKEESEEENLAKEEFKAAVKIDHAISVTMKGSYKEGVEVEKIQNGVRSNTFFSGDDIKVLTRFFDFTID